MSDLAVVGDGCRIFYRFDGPKDGPVLVFINSLGTANAIWDSQMAALTGVRRVLRFDMRGHGASDAPQGAYSLDRLGRDVEELLDLTGVAEADICGLSIGGMVGQWLGWRAPDRVRRLVLANTSPCIGPPSSWQARIEAVMKHGMQEIAEAVGERWFTAGYRASGGPGSESTRQMLLQTSAQGYAGCCAAIRDMDLRPTLKLIRAPALIIGGEFDPATPPDHAQDLAEKIPGARLTMLPAAHLSNLETPEQFNRLLLEFLTEGGS